MLDDYVNYKEKYYLMNNIYMSFALTMGNSRIDRIKLLQQERSNNQSLRKTGARVQGARAPIARVQGARAPGTKTPGARNYSLQQNIKPKENLTKINYIKCPYCSQQILNSTMNHHISFCQAAFGPSKTKGCTACERFRKS